MKKNIKIGLALGSGGWRGLAHIGVLKSLERNKIKIDCLAGSSAGALIGGLYLFYGSRKLEEIATGLRYRDLFKFIADPVGRSGLVKGKKLLAFLESHLGETKIEDLRIPFRPVATDLFTGKTVVLKRGNLAHAIRASISVPLLFEPVRRGERQLVDGATSQPIPVKVVKSMGVDFVMGVNLYKNFFHQDITLRRGGKIPRLTTARLAYQHFLYHLARYNSQEADFVVRPPIREGHYRIFLKAVNNFQTVEIGFEEMEKRMAKLKEKISFFQS